MGSRFLLLAIGIVVAGVVGAPSAVGKHAVRCGHSDRLEELKCQYRLSVAKLTTGIDAISNSIGNGPRQLETLQQGCEVAKNNAALPQIRRFVVSEAKRVRRFALQQNNLALEERRNLAAFEDRWEKHMKPANRKPFAAVMKAARLGTVAYSSGALALNDAGGHMIDLECAKAKAELAEAKKHIVYGRGELARSLKYLNAFAKTLVV